MAHRIDPRYCSDACCRRLRLADPKRETTVFATYLHPLFDELTDCRLEQPRGLADSTEIWIRQLVSEAKLGSASPRAALWCHPQGQSPQ